MSTQKNSGYRRTTRCYASREGLIRPAIAKVQELQPLTLHLRLHMEPPPRPKFSIKKAAIDAAVATKEA
jgi:hypothetical protein